MEAVETGMGGVTGEGEEEGGGAVTMGGWPSNHPTIGYLLSYMPTQSSKVLFSDGVRSSMAKYN